MDVKASSAELKKSDGKHRHLINVIKTW